MWILTVALTASAAAPTVSTDANGVVHATAIVAAPPEKPLALISDPLAMHAIGTGDGTLTATPNNACFDLRYRYEATLATVAYTARACPTSTGFRTDLVQSDSFAAMSSEWVVRAVPGGTELVYTYRQDLNIPVPDWMIRKRTEASVTTLMTGLVAKLGG